MSTDIVPVTTTSINYPPSKAAPRSPFDLFRKIGRRDDGTLFEYWSAREAMPLLGYSKWEHFYDAIERATCSCANSGCDVDINFPPAGKLIPVRGGGHREVVDFHMTRYGMYLLAMCCDTRKPEIAAAQRYFAIQTIRAEQQLPSLLAPQPVPRHVPRPWAERFHETFMAHQHEVIDKYPPGSFTVVTATKTEMLTLEDHLIQHHFEVRASDRPCISLGGTWSNYRHYVLGRPRGGIGEASITLAPGFTVDVIVYDSKEYGDYNGWLHHHYLPEKLHSYLANKPEWHGYAQLTHASAAVHACRALTGRPAKIPQRTAKQLAEIGGFAPVGSVVRELPKPRKPKPSRRKLAS